MKIYLIYSDSYKRINEKVNELINGFSNVLKFDLKVNSITDFSTIKTISKEEAMQKGLYNVLGEEMDDLYIAELKKNTKDAELASEFLDTFSRMVGIDAAQVGEPDGVLANK